MNNKFDELAKNMACFTRTPMCLAVAAQLGWTIQAADLYVDANAAAGGDGSVSLPYVRITDAVGRARQLRQSRAIRLRERIVIHVAAGNYVGTFNATKLDNNDSHEVLPIVLNVPNVALTGATVLDHDALGLPTGPSNGPQTKLKSGTTLSNTGQSLIAVTRTTDGWAGDGVAVTGFTLEESDSDNAVGIFVDRVAGFAIHSNAVLHTGDAIVARLSSGTVEDNFFVNRFTGPAIGGGSINHPAAVTLRRNRSTGGNNGADIRGSPSMRLLDAGANALQIEPLQVTYDRNNPADVRNIPDTLDVSVEGNDFSGNAVFGLWCFAFAPFVGYTTSDATQPMTSVVRTTITGNIFADNRFYGFVVEPQGAFRNDPRRFTSAFTGSFQENILEGNGRGGALLSFVAADVTLGFASLQDFKYVEQSAYHVTDLDGELAGFDYDNPATDPFSGMVLNNALTVNGATIPSGIKITPLKP